MVREGHLRSGNQNLSFLLFIKKRNSVIILYSHRTKSHVMDADSCTIFLTAPPPGYERAQGSELSLQVLYLQWRVG